MAQAIGRVIASLVVLKCHIWLNLTEIKDADKTTFFDSLVSHMSLFGSIVDSFAKCFTASQKSLQTMDHFLPLLLGCFFKLAKQSLMSDSTPVAPSTALSPT